MLKIKCPKCGEEIELGKDAYTTLIKEVQTEELNKQVREKTESIEKVLKAKYELEVSKTKTSQDILVTDLKNQIKLLNEKILNSNKDTELAVNKALAISKDELVKKNEEIMKLKNQMSSTQKDSDLSVQKMKEQYEFLLKAKDEEIERWKDYRVGDSTKDLGENLEQYCRDAFDEVRADAYPNAYFEKDNESIKGDGENTGTKGDFVFRDYSADGVEFVSIMFDMKTEKDNTENKKTNEYHLKKLDADRTKKGCEYAVLVSTLEGDSKLYNKGIVDVSHKYPKTFVVRPQFFLAIIGLIRNMAKNTLKYKRQVRLYEKENADITNFEKAVRQVADKINADYDKANAIYNDVDEMCDGIIKKVESFRKQFKVASGHLGAAVNQLSNLEVRKLTKNNPTMQERFDSLNNNSSSKEEE